jgi:hypothetical protein
VDREWLGERRPPWSVTSWDARCTAASRMKIERVEGFRLETACARRELQFLDHVRHARDDARFRDLAARGIHRDLRDIALWVDCPLDDQIAFDSGVARQALVVASTGFVAARGDDGSDVVGASARVVRMGAPRRGGATCGRRRPWLRLGELRTL